MNGHDTEPPDGHKPKNNAFHNDLIFCEMEIKQEPTVKQEPKDNDDIATVSRSSYTVNSVTYENLIGDEQMGSTDDCIDFHHLTQVKWKVKIKEEVNQVAIKKGDKNHQPQNNPMSNKSNGGDGGAKVGKKDKVNNARDVKEPPEGKATGKRHKCSLCEYVTVKTTNLNRHMLKHTGERPFPCTICSKQFTRKLHLQSHMKTHVDEFLFSCSTCLQGFHRSEEKVEHESDCKVRRYECHLCKEYSTVYKTNFEVHLHVHTGERPFECDHCSMKFNQSRTLKCHLKTHTNPHPLKFKCSTCFKIFAQQMEKENHEANCKRRGYECVLCKTYTTDRKDSLVKHMRIHTGEKLFRCEKCSKCFNFKSSINRHQKVHK